MIGQRVTRSSGPWAIGGRVEQRHDSHDQLYGIRALDGHLYWQWSSDFKTRTAHNDLFGALV